VLTEGGRSTLLVRLDGCWTTPPLTAGVLPGVVRAALLADPVWRVSERVLWPADLQRAEALAVCNALRGVLPAVLIGNPDTIQKDVKEVTSPDTLPGINGDEETRCRGDG